MPVFRCSGCGIPGVSCTFVKDDTYAILIGVEDLSGFCPKRDHIPVWWELQVVD